MHNTKAVLEYWQHGLQQQLLAAVSLTDVKDYLQIISRAECDAGQINDPKILAQLRQHGSKLVVVPVYAKSLDKYFFPYSLMVELDEAGNFIPNVICAYPVVSNRAVEPADLNPIALSTADNFDNYFVLQPPSWLEDPKSLNWTSQLNYAQQMLSAVTTDTWQDLLLKTGYMLQSGAIVFPLSLLGKTDPVMDIKLLNNKSKIKLIAADRHSGKDKYIIRLVQDAWIEAAVKQALPPEYVWYKSDKEYYYSSIFDFAPKTDDGVIDLDLLHATVTQYFNAYFKGQRALKNWQDMQEKITAKYADKGGIMARLDQLKQQIKDIHARHRLMQVLHSIWIRQLELVPTWSRILDFMPWLQKQRLQRLFTFFKQNFPTENVLGFSQKQLDALIQDKLRRAANSERFVADALHQSESDLRQVELVRDKCLLWAQMHDCNADSITSVTNLLDKNLWPKLLHAAAQYWRARFIAADNFNQFLQVQPTKIDLLILEHAEYVSPMQAAQLLAISQRAIIFGNYNPICNPRFSVHIDYELAKHCKLVHCDADYEDLQFDGVSAAVGNCWNLAAQNKDADLNFVKYTNTELSYELVNVESVSAAYMGSRINAAEVTAILNWLESNWQIGADIAVYTCFSGQAQYLRNKLQATSFAGIDVRLVQEPYFKAHAISLFSPVYTLDDSAPYNFDRGAEILENLTVNTQQRIIVFGDQRIFKPNLHSAVGNFAKLLLKQTEEEVSCV